MVLRGWLLLLTTALYAVRCQDATGTCNGALGLSSGSVGDSSITSLLEDSTPSAGRLNNAEGAWCFGNDSIASRSAALVVDLGRRRFVSGFASQGPPPSVQPKTYNHLVAFSTAHSLDKVLWEEFNDGHLYFDGDKNETSDVLNYHVSSTVEFTQYVKINVTMQVSGSTTICLRFEIYGCDTDITPSTSIQALTTTKGKIDVKWKTPTIETSLGEDANSFGSLRPNAFIVRYRPMESESKENTVWQSNTPANHQFMSLEDVRLGATYVIHLTCHFINVSVSCGSTQVEAYPPCPEDFTGGNEYHCFLYLNSVSSLSEARETCLNSKFDQQIGTLGYIVDEEERKFLASRIIPEDASEFWLIDDSCQDNEKCCTALKLKGETLEDTECADKTFKAALCLRDHKGEGARLRVSSVQSSEDGSSALFTWRYEGIGWKTDELQVKMWISDQGDKTSTQKTFSTLNNDFEVKAEAGVLYALLLRPAPNIRSEEFVYRFIIVDFQEETNRYGAVLTPVPMSKYIIWSGSIRITWEEAKTLSKSGESRPAEKYSITHQMTSAASTPTTVEIESGREFLLTPIAMQVTYVFKMSCLFAGAYQPCGEVSVTTDPPDLVLPKPSKIYVIYQVIQDKVKTWSEAEDDCQQRSGHLTSLLDEAEAKALLKMLPTQDSKIWTGAKLGKKATGYWTDGEKITDLPMAKNSGVTSSSESCCRAINELGRLKLAGGSCAERYPYICKYTVEEVMTVPSQLRASDLKWDSFELSWAKTEQRWLPTFYKVRVCLAESQTNCILKDELKDLWNLKLENLVQFKNYDVEVEAALRPVNVKTSARISVMTYPKSPVQLTISPKGESSVSCPILKATGESSASISATLFQMDITISTVTGGIEDLAISRLGPEETYKLELKQEGGDWTHEMTFDAEPTCSRNDVEVESVCYSLEEENKNFDGATKHCSQSAEGKPLGLWSPKSTAELTDVVKSLGIYLNIWIQRPKEEASFSIGTDSSCSSGGDATCCFYDVPTSSVRCSSCCDRELSFVCAYQIKEAYLGEIANLLPSFVGNKSIGVEWSPPEDVSWSIRRFELEWLDAETLASVGKEVVVGATEKLIEELEYGTEYDVMVTPLGAKDVRGVTSRILITTLDPRTPVSVKVGSDGAAEVFSPLLIEKGKGSTEVKVALYTVDEKTKEESLLSTHSGVAQKVEISGLEVGKLYSVKMTPVKSDKMFEYNTEFNAYPSCEENQIQDGPVCVWASAQTKPWSEAYEVCRGDNGQLLDYKTQGELKQPVKALLTSYIQQNFWLEMGSEGTAALRDADSSGCPKGQESEVMCCSYEVSEEGELNNLLCKCCDGPRAFACKKEAKIDLGDIGEVFVEDVTTTSLTLSWTAASATKWQKPSYLITWSEVSQRKKREVEKNQIVTKDSPASVKELKPGTKYSVSVAPYTEAAKSSGNSKRVVVTTRDDLTIAGMMGEYGCMIVVFKISCCVTVILGSSFTIFVFIATRMYYLDCLAQMYAEIGTLGAYICILISSAQSYSNDSQCLRAHAELCIAVSVLIQFFFQVVFMFAFLESVQICGTLKDYLPQCRCIRSPLAMMISGFGFPGLMMIVLAAVASDGFSDGNDNCWLDLQGSAMLPSVIPVVAFGAISGLLLMSVFDANEPKEELPFYMKARGRIYLKTRYGSFVILLLTSVCYATGMFGVNNRDAILNYVFVGFSTALGILMPVIRIKLDGEVGEQLKRGLFNSLRDEVGGIRVSPAPDKYDPNPLLSMSDFENRKYKQLEQLRNKKSMNAAENVWHQ